MMCVKLPKQLFLLNKFIQEERKTFFLSQVVGIQEKKVFFLTFKYILLFFSFYFGFVVTQKLVLPAVLACFIEEEKKHQDDFYVIHIQLQRC